MKAHVIVAQDADLAVLDMICDCLSDEGYHVVAHTTYQDAFEQIIDLKPSVAIIELLCTNPTSAIMLLDTMRCNPQTMHIPVIITSSDNKLLHSTEAVLHAQNYITLQKPFDLEELFALIDRMINLHRSGETGLAIECGGQQILY